jgi:F-type H+-transporting ATPase subunit delta
MAELSTIARPYAEALFATAQASGAAAQWRAPLEELAAVTRDPQVANVVADPKLTAAQIFDLIAGLMKQPLPDGLKNFLNLAIENGRLAVLPEVARQFRRLKNEAEGVADCLIESALPLTDAQVNELLALLGRKFAVKLKPEVKVEPSLIGGVRVSVGDQVLDSSVRAQLEAMRAALTA